MTADSQEKIDLVISAHRGEVGSQRSADGMALHMADLIGSRVETRIEADGTVVVIAEDSVIYYPRVML